MCVCVCVCVCDRRNVHLQVRCQRKVFFIHSSQNVIDLANHLQKIKHEVILVLT